MILGLFLGILIYSLVETTYINSMVAQDLPLENMSVFFGYYVLPPYYWLSFVIGGIVSGYFLGEIWWRLSEKKAGKQKK